MSLTQNEVPAAVSLAGNPVFVNYETDEGAEDFIGIHYIVQAYLNSTWTQLGNEMRLELDDNDAAEVDIHKLLEWDPEREFTWPEAVSDIIIKRNDLRRQFRILVDEMYGNPLEVGDEDTATGYYVLPGKVSNLKFGLLNDESTTWWSDNSGDKKFLTNGPREKTTDAWASERLYFILSAAPGSSEINLQVKIYYTDDTTSTITRETQSSAAQYDVYEIITSFSTLGLYIKDTSKTIEKYEVWLEDGASSVISEVYTYVLDHVRKPDSKYFIFANAYKMPEGMRFTGKSSRHTEYSFLKSHREFSNDYGVDDPSMIKSNSREVEFREISSGWVTLEEINWMREILLSNEVFEIVNGEIVPVIIETEKLVINEDDSNLRELTIVYRYAHADQVPGLIPEIEDGFDAFSTGSDLLATSSVYSNGFTTFTYSNGTVTEVVGNGPMYGLLNPELNVRLIPLILKYSSWGNYDYPPLAYLYSGTTPADVGMAIGIETTINQEGYGVLYSDNAGAFRLGLSTYLFDNDLDSFGELELYYATKRYMEYLYELSL